MTEQVVSTPTLPRCDNTFEDLPTEIVSLIIEWLNPEEIITLGCVNQRLNSISFSAYFSSKDWQPSMLSSHYGFDGASVASCNSFGGVVYHPFHALKALRLAFYERRPEAISAVFLFSVDNFVEDANHAQNFLRNAPQLRRLKLRPSARTHADGSPRAELSKVYDAFVGLLKSLHCIPQLGDLTIQGSIPVPPSSSVLGPKDIPVPMHVSTVTLDSCDCLVSSSLVDWSIHALNTMPIRRVDLGDSMLSSHEDRIHMPFIEDISIYCPPPAFAVGAFLSRHPTITSFLLHCGLRNLHEDRVPLQHGALPNLTQLNADMNYINIWLAQGSVMPKLQSLTAHIPGHLPGAQNVLANELLSLVAKRPSITSLTLPLCFFTSEDFFPADHNLSHIDDLRIGSPGLAICEVPADIEHFIASVKLFTGVRVLQFKNLIPRDVHEWRVKVKPLLAEHCPFLDFKI